MTVMCAVEYVWKHRTIFDSVQYNNANSRTVTLPIERQGNGVTSILQPLLEVLTMPLNTMAKVMD